MRYWRILCRLVFKMEEEGMSQEIETEPPEAGKK
jgi:hypothetical protein